MEKAILKRISEGDIEAFEWIFFQYQPKLYHFLSGFTHNAEVSKDLAQDIFFHLWNNRKNITRINSFSSYLFGMAKFTIYNYYDRINTEEKHSKYYRQTEDCGPEEAFFVKELQSAINNIVEQMPPRRRAVFKMSRYDGLGNGDIAKELNIDKRTVENHITSALMDLRRKLFSNIHTAGK